MSLDRAQLAQTGADLRRNLDLTGLTHEQLAAWLGLPDAELAGILAMDGHRSPVAVWLVRDAIEQAARAAGHEPKWCVLDAASRRKAERWFTLGDVPDRESRPTKPVPPSR